MVNKEKIIGLIGGIGPAAGINLVGKLVAASKAEKDQDHISWILMNMPGEIVDRTDFLLGKTDINPGSAIANQIMKLEQMACNVACIACNTAHAPVIFNEMLRVLDRENSKIKVINVIEETIRFTTQLFRSNLSQPVSIGILATTGTYLTRLYRTPLEEAGFKVVDPGEDRQDIIHDSIYNTEYGIKAKSNPVDPRVVASLNEVISFYRSKGIGALLFGCTEITLLENMLNTSDIEVIKPMDILARVLTLP
ncbi:MAG: amino acid racemase [Bacteroidota bacterium]|nr:amino acid racemase [Bacteroidota bacterium]